ncbi:PIN domain-containing protein [Lysobacter silvisoli]|uniref:PIN domain-containing protein n=1 Tax=Lysobacter silvisoli TaxID=2293254 RepID=A0A371K600_9GAMM|nr:PIN domain-containing protein [Lysobacter silvisoli]RDZ29336.1 PIN domain-containing protein [Lysobacter silvisoli]
MSAPPRLVLDTNVCLDLFVFRDPRLAALSAALASGATTAVSDERCREEWQRVLAYPQLRLDAAAQGQALSDYDARLPLWPASQRRPEPAAPLPRCFDPDDQKFLELAHAASADCVLSRDHALTSLGRRCAREGLFEVMTPLAWIGLQTWRQAAR